MLPWCQPREALMHSPNFDVLFDVAESEREML